MATNKLKPQKSAACGTKPKGSVGLGSETLLPSAPFELSTGAYEFIWDQDKFINDETLRFVRDAFKGFRDEVQDMMADCLRKYFEEVGPEGEQHLPLLGVEHIDMLLNHIVYRIERGYNRY